MTGPVLPTHTCFDDALDLFTDLLAIDSGWSQHLFLVHGIMEPEAGTRYAHAWLETDDERVFFVGILEGERRNLQTTRHEYHDEMRVVESVRYDWVTVLRLNDEFENYGPWETRYLELCAPRGTVIEA